MGDYDWKKTTFAEATAVKPLSSHTYEGFFPNDWCIGNVPHGGVVCANLLAVTSLHFKTTLSSQNQPHTIAIHVDYLRRTEQGPVFFSVTDTKLGRQTSIIHISLSQGPAATQRREEVICSITQSNLHTEEGLTLHTDYKLTPPPPPVDLVALKNDTDKNWARQKEMPFAKFRKASTKIQFHFPRAGQVRGLGDEWVHLTTGERFTNNTLGFIADMFAMPVESIRAKDNPYDINAPKDESEKKALYWYPTVLLNIDIKKSLPEEGVEWLFSRVQAKQIKNGRMDLEIVILDQEGDIVALSHHVCLVLPAARNTAKRSDVDSKI